MADASLILQLVESKGLVSSEQLQAVRGAVSDTSDEALVEEMSRKGFIDRRAIIDLLAEEFSMPSIDLAAIDLPADPSEFLSESFARRYQAFPIGIDNGALQLAISDPLNVESVDSLSHLLKMPVEPVLADQRQIEKVIEVKYKAGGEAVSTTFTDGDALAGSQVGLSSSSIDLGGSLSGEDDAPIIRLVQVIISEAIKLRASDIHLEPLENRFRLRYRIDGNLQESSNPPPKRLQLPVISRVKVMSKMSIAEKRLPQDGRIQVRVDGSDYDLRVSSLPTAYGESIVMRILDKSGLMKGLADLGLMNDDQEIFENLITLPDGILLVTGPTGSGKTTTLYSCLGYINKSDRKIITVEDPIEYQMPGINQVPVQKRVGMTFAAALKAILRQAPNIIMVGEIRDKETAEIAINASLTGHMVFSTLHTNDAPSAVTRLVDIGVKPYLVATSLRAAMAQRLVRRICPHCSRPYQPTTRELNSLELDLATTTQFMRGVGCEECFNQGMVGRFGIFEIFLVNDEMERLIYTGGTSVQLRALAKQMGMRTMREDGVRKVLAGQTTIEEVMSVTVAEPKLV